MYKFPHMLVDSLAQLSILLIGPFQATIAPFISATNRLSPQSFPRFTSVAQNG